MPNAKAPSPSSASFRRELAAHASEERAAISQRFFRTGPGEYGEGDRFAGVRVPDTRKVVRSHRDMTLADVQTLLASPLHEERLGAVLLLVDQMKRRRSVEARREVYELYLR